MQQTGTLPFCHHVDTSVSWLKPTIQLLVLQIVRQLETQADADVQAIQGRQVQSVAATQAQQSVPIQV